MLGVVEACQRDGAWLPVGSPFRRTPLIRVTAGLLSLVMRTALAISPRLAIYVAAASYGVVDRVKRFVPRRAG